MEGLDLSSPLKNYQNNPGRMNPPPTLKEIVYAKSFEF